MAVHEARPDPGKNRGGAEITMTRLEYAKSIGFKMSHFPEPDKELDRDFIDFVNMVKEECKLHSASAYGRSCYGH